MEHIYFAKSIFPWKIKSYKFNHKLFIILVLVNSNSKIGKQSNNLLIRFFQFLIISNLFMSSSAPKLSLEDIKLFISDTWMMIVSNF